MSLTLGEFPKESSPSFIEEAPFSCHPKAVSSVRALIFQPKFVFVACQHGSEPTLKSKFMQSESGLRLAFSRPGLLTFKLEEDVQLDFSAESEVGEKWPVEPPQHWLARQTGFAIGQVRGENASDLVKQVVDMAGTDWKVGHVFSRDNDLPGNRGYEPGPTELSMAVESELNAALPTTDFGDPSPARRIPILDVILIDPGHWLVGFHQNNAVQHSWPGGVFPFHRPEEVISRAYYKIAEAIAWSRFPMQAGDSVVEIGSSPGGACQRLLDLGLKVTGVDPAEMDPSIVAHPRFEHWRSKTAGLKRKRFRRFKWLVADANVAPNYTLDMVEDLVTYPGNDISGLLLTLKLSSYELVDKMPEYLLRIRKWGYKRVDVRQLAPNRRECCVAASR